MNLHPRLQREANTIQAMFLLYCRENHGIPDELCASCRELKEYALSKLEHCPFQERKTTCAKCPIHCYKPEMRMRVREMMRFSGPRMLFHHPWLTIRHLLDGLREKPLPKKNFR